MGRAIGCGDFGVGTELPGSRQFGGTDIAVTACMVALVYHFRTGRDSTWPGRLAWPTFWYAAAVLAKASGLVFGPLCMVVLEAERLARQAHCGGRLAADFGNGAGEPGTPFRPLRRNLVVILGAGMALVFVYCGCDWKSEPSFSSLGSFASGRWDKPGDDLAGGSSAVFSNAGEAIVRQIGHNMRGHGVYLLGATGPSYFWYYFPVASP